MTKQDAKDLIRFLKRNYGVSTVISETPTSVRDSYSGMSRLYLRKGLFKKLSLRYRHCGNAVDAWKSVEWVTFGSSYDKLDLFAQMWSAITRSGRDLICGFFPSNLDDIDYVVDEARVGETFTLPCADSVEELRLKIAIMQ